MTSPPSRKGAACALLLGSCLLAGSAFAADRAASAPAAQGGVASLGKGRGNELPILTREQLRACLKQQDQLKSQEDAIVAEQRGIDAEKASIGQEETALKDELAGLDRTAASAVAGYNAKALEHEHRIDAYNQRSRPFNAKVEAWRGAHEGWARDCGNRRYQENDLIIIKAGR